MAKGHDGSGKTSAHDFEVFLFAIGGAFLLLGLFWFLAHNFLSAVMVRSREVELYLIGYAMSIVQGDNAPLNFARYYASQSTYNLSYGSTLQVMRESGVYVRWIFAPILLVIGAVLYLRAPTKNFKKSHTMKSLAEQEAKLWPEIAPTLKFNLTDGDITIGPWSVSQTEWEFARKHQLVAPIPDSASAAPVALLRNRQEQREALVHEKAHTLYREQLGPRWRGIDKLPPYAKGIFAALAIRVAAISLIDTKQKEAAIARATGFYRKMAGDFAEAAVHVKEMDAFWGRNVVKEMDFSWADGVIDELRDHELIRMVQERHGYVFTVLATMLQISRNDGVNASAMVTWLRPVDRRLWYILNGVGGYAFVAEAAGIAAHWLAEKEIGTRLIYPAVGEAVRGLDEGLKQYIEANENEEMFK